MGQAVVQVWLKVGSRCGKGVVNGCSRVTQEVVNCGVMAGVEVSQGWSRLWLRCSFGGVRVGRRLG